MLWTPLWYIMQGEALNWKTESYFSAIESASNGGEVACLLLFGKLNGWLYIAMQSVSADRQAQERNALKNRREWKSVCVCVCVGGERDAQINSFSP